MIPYDYKLAIRIFRLIREQEGVSKFSPRQFVANRFYALFLYLINNVFLLIDEIVFFSYRKITVRAPIFIIGPPRSGTSFFHRLLAENQQFTSMRLWEMTFAPSITQKYLFLGLAKLDSLLGGPINRKLKKLDSRLFKEINKIHKTGLFEYEEDAHLFQHTGTTPYMAFNWPFKEVQDLFFNVDEVASDKFKLMNMRFYEKCIKKHLFVFGKNKTYVSKNPTFSSYVVTLREKFADANFLYIYRTPYEVVPSAMSLATFSVNQFSNLDQQAIKSITMAGIKKYYLHPLKALDFSANNNVIVSYVELVKFPKSTIEMVFNKLGLTICQEYGRYLDEQDEKSKGFVSENRYTYEQYGLSEAEITTVFQSIFDLGIDSKNKLSDCQSVSVETKNSDNIDV